MSEAANHPLPDEVTEKAKHHILDTLAAMISGSTLLPGKPALAFAQVYGGDETCTIVASKLSRGAIEAVLACCEIPVTVIEPNAWKRFHRLHGRDKEGGRQRALQLFHAAHAMLARRKDHGRGEASLIALYGAQA